MPEIMSGFIRMPKESSKIITLQESGLFHDSPEWVMHAVSVSEASRLFVVLCYVVLVVNDC